MLKFLGVVLAVVLSAIVGVVAIGWRIIGKDLPSVPELVQERKQEIMSNQASSKVYASDEKTVILENGKFVIHPVKLADVSPHFTKALVATEDRRFYAHRGIDPVAIGRAVLRNAKSKGMKEGGSTLTQQLARLLFLSNERTLTRKLKEAIVSVQLEKELSKDEILELYMNYVYYGQGAYGIDTASEVYFNKKPKDLTVTEAAMLAGMPQAPSAYNPLYAPKLAKARRNEVIQNLVEVRAISVEDARKYQAMPLGLNKNLSRLALTNKAPYFNQMVEQQAKDLLGLEEEEFWERGLKIFTTLDMKANGAARTAFDEQAKAYNRTDKNSQMMLMSMNSQTGAILAYEGGKNFVESQYDRIQRSPRSPGSTFKVFTYTEAMRQGISPYRVMVDAPISFGNWSPHNYDRRYRGAMTLMRALGISNNVIAVKLMNELGPDAVMATAKEMGIQSPLIANLTATLGGSSVYMVEMVRSFGTLSNHGVRVNPHFITRIEGKNGEVLYKQDIVKTRVLDEGVADTMTTMLQHVAARGTGRGAQYGGPIAGKTGTSDEYRDAWFMGYTPSTVTGVWVGNDDNTSMAKTITGGSMPAQTWKTFMTNAGYSRKGFKLNTAHTATKEQAAEETVEDPVPMTIEEAAEGAEPIFEDATTGEPDLETLRSFRTSDKEDKVDPASLSPADAEALLRKRAAQIGREKEPVSVREKVKDKVQSIKEKVIPAREEKANPPVPTGGAAAGAAAPVPPPAG